MKNTIYILSIVALSAIILQCEKETQESLPVDHVKTILGGCNGQSFDEIMLARYEEKDTLKFYIKNDTLLRSNPVLTSRAIHCFSISPTPVPLPLEVVIAAVCAIIPLIFY